ncbi:MAG: MopE-related protein [Sandaracinus sp.]
MRAVSVGAIVLASCLVGCPGPSAPPADDDGGPTDAATTDARADGGHDAATAPDVGLDASCPDADGDTHADAACGGDDCDDRDADRFPGNGETCDASAHDEDCDPTTFGVRDVDGDGHQDAACCNGTLCGDDCNDARADVAPGQTEACNAIDDDCDSATDEGVLVTLYPDGDGDGHGAGTAEALCPGLPHYATSHDDCDDTDVSRYPGATELCDDHLDNDCDTLIDESGARVFYADADGDGFGDPGNSTMRAECTPPTGYAANSRDCNDAIASIHPGANDLCDGLDNDCSIPGSGGVELAEDRDMDGHSPASATCSGGAPKDDCNDTRADTFPGATELCDARDNDCSSGGGTDPAEDADGDRHVAPTTLCSGGSYPADDCDDGTATVYGGAPEPCDGVDQNCSTGGGMAADEDGDGDGHASSSAACSGGPLPKDDCRDADANSYLGAPELCDRIDNDCSSGGGVVTGEDADGDMHAAPAAACSGGLPKDDCNDGVATTYPGAPELCDRIDSDCSVGGGTETAEDADSDGRAPTTATCTGGPLPRTDCNDAAANVFSGAPEICDGVDNDCSTGGLADAGEDADGDLHASPAAACVGGPYPKDDCVDSSATIHPGASELCDRIDDDCSTGGGVLASEDVDDDGHAAPTAACNGVRPRDDCDDAVATTYPGAPEVCDRVDQDCSVGGAPETAEDADRDGFAPIAAACTGGYPRTDCNDASATAHPGATETCGGGDEDCDGSADPVDTDAGAWCGVRATCSASDRCLVARPIATGGQGSQGVTAALRSGALYTWGQGSAGSLGTGSSASEPRPRPVPIAAVTTAVGVTVGNLHSCAWRSDGTVACWGSHTELGVASDVLAPTHVAAVAGAIEVAANDTFTCARFADRTVSCWGDGHPTPAPVLGITGATQIAAGGNEVCAVTATGVRCWTTSSFGGVSAVYAVNSTSGAIEVAVSQDLDCVRYADGTVGCWGTSTRSDGQWGDGTPAGLRSEPSTRVLGLTDAIAITAGRRTASGSGTACALRATGAVVCWGSGVNGRIGDGGTTSRAVPTAVSGLTDAVAIGGAGTHTCAQRASGAVVCWGSADSGQLGDGTDTTEVPFAVPVSGIGDAVEISGSNAHFCARRAGGSVLCWGGIGPLGDGSTSASATPVAVSGLTDAIDLGSTQDATCAVRSGGAIACWGQGPLGDGSSYQTTPVAVTGIADARSISDGVSFPGGGGHFCVRRAGNALACWGTNGSGQLGNGATMDSPTPVATSFSIADATGLTTGSAHTCASRTAGTVSCWGNSVSLGNGTSASFVPVLATGLADAVEVSSGSFHTCARSSTGVVRCWGYNQQGQLGDGTTSDRPTPTASPISDAISLGVYDQTSCAVRADGTVACWGDGAGGALGGLRLPDFSTAAVPVVGVSGATSVDCASGSCCALLASGAVSCWGYRDALGNPSVTPRPLAPVTVVDLP